MTTLRDRIALAETGSGPPVLLVHGLGGFKESWGRVPDLLAASGRRAIAVDLPGWGESPGRRGDPHDAEWYAERLAPLVTSLEHPLVVGHSLGAQVAVGLALRCPGRVERLGLISPQVVRRAQRGWWPRVPQDWAALPVVGPLASRAFFHAFRCDDARLTSGFAAVVSNRRRLAESEEARGLLELAKARFRATSPGVWARALNNALRTDLRRDAGRLDAPTLVLVGADDRITEPGPARSLANAIPHARLAVLDGVGHLPQIEAPDLLVGALLELIDG